MKLASATDKLHLAASLKMQVFLSSGKGLPTLQWTNDHHHCTLDCKVLYQVLVLQRLLCQWAIDDSATIELDFAQHAFEDPVHRLQFHLLLAVRTRLIL